MNAKPLSFCLIALCQVHAGLSWKSLMTISDSGRPPLRIQARVQAQDGNMREDFDTVPGASAGLARAGTWWLFRTDSHSIAVVNPNDKSYMELPTDSLMGAATHLMGLGEMRLNNPKVTWKEGTDDTDHVPGAKAYTLHVSYEMEIKVILFDNKSQVDEVRSIWVSPQWPIADLQGDFQRQLVHTGLPGLDSLVAKEVELQKALKQMVVHTVSTRRSTDAKGKVRTSVTRMDVQELKKTAIASSRFTIPADYKKIEMPTAPAKSAPPAQSPPAASDKTPKIDPTTLLKGLFR